MVSANADYCEEQNEMRKMLPRRQRRRLLEADLERAQPCVVALTLNGQSVSALTPPSAPSRARFGSINSRTPIRRDDQTVGLPVPAARAVTHLQRIRNYIFNFNLIHHIMMVAQANKTSKNTTNEIENIISRVLSVPLLSAR